MAQGHRRTSGTAVRPSKDQRCRSLSSSSSSHSSGSTITTHSGQLQDSWVVQECAESQSKLLFGCFDGHGKEGHKVSSVLAQHLPAVLFSSPEFRAGNYESAFARVFAGLNADMTHEASGIDTLLSGSTAVAAVLRQDGRLSVANVGDSRAILGRVLGNGLRAAAVPLTQDHKPDLPSEQARILANNGLVGWSPAFSLDGPPRVWLRDQHAPGLAMSRSFGDTLAASVGVTAEPDVVEVQLTPADRYLVICSDGITEFMDNAEVVAHVHCLAQLGWPAADVARALVAKARSRWAREQCGAVDDCTIVVCYLSVISVPPREPTTEDVLRSGGSTYS